MPPFLGWHGQQLPEDLGEEPPEGLGDVPPEGLEDDWEDDAEPYVRIASLEDLAAFVAHPEDYYNGEVVCVVGVRFPDAPLMLERLQEALKGDLGIQFVGNLDCLQRTSGLHAGLSRLLGSLRNLRNKLGDDGSIDWAAVATIKDESPLLVALCGEQQNGVDDRALTLIDNVREMLGTLPEKTVDAGLKCPSALVNAILSRLADLLPGMDTLLLEGVVLEYPEPVAETFMPVHNQEVGELPQPQWYIRRIQGREDLSSILDEPHRNFMQDHFSVAELRFADARSMFKDLRKAADEKGWWVGNIDRLEQACLLHGRVTCISRSVRYVLSALQDSSIDWFELESISNSMLEIHTLYTLQPEDFCTSFIAVMARVEQLLEFFPPKPENLDDAPDYAPEVFTTLIDQIGDLPAAMNHLCSTSIKYPNEP